MARITIIGGTGLIGGKVAARLGALGHDVTAAGRSDGVDLLTGDGLECALEGAEIVLDASGVGTAEIAEEQQLFARSASNLAGAEQQAGVKRHVLLSVIGARTIAGGLFSAKAGQESIVEAGTIPFTIVRSAPFFETLYSIVDAASDGGDIRLPPIVIQPIAADDVATNLVDILLDSSAGPLIEMGGPETSRLADFAEAILAANEDNRRVQPDPLAPFLGARMRDETLAAFENARLGTTAFEDWLRQFFFRHAPGPAARPSPLRIRSSRQGVATMTEFINPEAVPSGLGCAECLAEGGWWFHLRRCAQCGHVGCCDSSPSRHAAAHFHDVGHPIIRSFEPGETWFWDYRRETLFEGPELATPASRPDSQPAPGPAGAVPADWTRQLHRPRRRLEASVPGDAS